MFKQFSIEYLKLRIFAESRDITVEVDYEMSKEVKVRGIRASENIYIMTIDGLCIFAQESRDTVECIQVSVVELDQFLSLREVVISDNINKTYWTSAGNDAVSLYAPFRDQVVVVVDKYEILVLRSPLKQPFENMFLATSQRNYQLVRVCDKLLTQMNITNCGICFEPLGDIYLLINHCGIRTFHKECIAKFSYKCVICKTIIPAQDLTNMYKCGSGEK